MSGKIDYEALYRMLASPSHAPQLSSEQVAIGGFDPYAPTQVVTLQTAPEAQSSERSPLLSEKNDAYITTERPPSSEPPPPSGAPEVSNEAESYLAFLDQVQANHQNKSAPPSKKSRKKRGRRSSPSAQSASVQSVSTQAPSDQSVADTRPLSKARSEEGQRPAKSKKATKSKESPTQGQQSKRRRRKPTKGDDS